MPPINFNLLVMADMLQDYIVDKTTGGPLSGGIITFYQDTARTVLKNVYYQVGTPGNYSYIAFPNPMQLSASGTFQDNNGNDVIPFYYPFDENNPTTPTRQAYYITVYSSNSDGTPAVLQFTRENFPLATQQNASTISATNKNYIINKEFWRNIGSQNITALSTTLAPSQHEGFSMPDIQFIKNTTDATETVSFDTFVPPSSAPTFPDQVLQGDITPEFYMNLDCTGEGTETSKVLQFPLSFHIKSLSGATGTITFQGMNVGGNINNMVSVAVLQFLGTGGATPVTMNYGSVALPDTWQKFTFQIILPSAQNVITSSTGDDALYLQLGFPTAVTTNVNIAMPSFYLSTTAPTNDFSTYDQIAAITSSPRTGDFRISLNSFTPYGWVPANDGTIGTPSSGATTRANTDTWPLYSLLWNNFSQAAAPVTGGRGSSAFADWNANKTIQLTLTLGRVIAGTQPGSGVGGTTFGSTTQTLSIANMPNHDHPGSTATIGIGQATAVASTFFYSPLDGSGSGAVPVTVAPQGGGTSFSIQQPTVLQNIFLKL